MSKDSEEIGRDRVDTKSRARAREARAHSTRSRDETALSGSLLEGPPRAVPTLALLRKGEGDPHSHAIAQG